MKDLKKRTPTYFFDSRSHYFRKNHGAPYLWLANAAWILGFALGHTRRRLMNRPDLVHRSRVFLDFLNYNFAPRTRRLDR
jgi:N-acetylglucosaminyl-diphospho-decaprenol L-rhamnosyltransferase